MPAERLSMPKVREVLRLKHTLGMSYRQISEATGIGKTVVGEYVRRAGVIGITWPVPEAIDDAELERRLFPVPGETALPRPAIDWRKIHEEMKRPSVTLVLLWQEYRSEQADGYGYSRFSNRPLRVKRFQTIHPLQCRCRSRARASLRNRHQGRSIMGFEDEVEQSFGRPCRQCDCRFKRLYDLTSSIVPRGTSFHRSVELECPSIGLDAARFSCCCCGLFSGPAELGAVNPYAVHDHSQPTCQGHDRLFHPTAPGDLHCPGFEPGPFLRSML